VPRMPPEPNSMGNWIQTSFRPPLSFIATAVKRTVVTCSRLRPGAFKRVACELFRGNHR